MKRTGDSRDLRQGKNIIMLVVAAVSLLLAIGIGIALPSLTITAFSKVMAVFRM